MSFLRSIFSVLLASITFPLPAVLDEHDCVAEYVGFNLIILKPVAVHCNYKEFEISKLPTKICIKLPYHAKITCMTLTFSFGIVLRLSSVVSPHPTVSDVIISSDMRPCRDRLFAIHSLACRLNRLKCLAFPENVLSRGKH